MSRKTKIVAQAFQLATALMVIAIGCSSQTPFIGFDEMEGSGFSTASLPSEVRELNPDPVAATQMLYQGILWRDRDVPGSDGYVSLIRSKRVVGIQQAAVFITADPISREFKNRIEAVYPAQDILRRLTLAFFEAEPTASDTNRFLRNIQNRRTESTVSLMVKDPRFFQRLARLPSVGTPTYPTPVGPTPTPTIPPISTTCGLPALPETNNCERNSPSYLADVERALDTVIAQHPEYFDLNQQIATGAYRVVRPDDYLNAVANVMRGMGYCVHPDVGEEIAIKKNTNSFNEQYDILTWQLWMRRGAGSYRASCYPSWF
ncbi:MAG: hypothetical protein IT289_01175 [Oligoflexia bacterium]|nr:hypothetical protein [Oligoflexia bacterium]